MRTKHIQPAILFLLAFSLGKFTFAEEVIWRVPRTASSMAVVPDRVESDPLGPAGGTGARDYAVAQVLVECGPGVPRIGMPGTINRMRTFFANDPPVDFEFFPNATQNPATGNFEIQGLAIVNVFQVTTPFDLPSPNQNPDNGVIVEATFIQDVNNDQIIVQVEDLINSFPNNPIVIKPGSPYYIGLTPFFIGFPERPFSGLHFANDLPFGNEGESAVRQTAPEFLDWSFAGATFGNGDKLYATIEINGPPLFKLGDLNGDGVVNLLDVVPFVNVLSRGQYVKEADINGDGFVNLLDVRFMVELLTGG